MSIINRVLSICSCVPIKFFAVGGLPLMYLDDEHAARVVQIVEKELWTPMGPRSLSPMEKDYVGHYQGGSAERDGIYHQGTVWPWLGEWS